MVPLTNSSTFLITVRMVNRANGGVARRAALIIGLLCLGCEASDREVDERERGELIFSSAVQEIYRSDHRIQLVAIDPQYAAQPGCGYLTERAEADVDRVLASLDPEKDYRIDVEACRSRWFDSGTTRVHIEGFTYSPFVCESLFEGCCDDEIAALEVLYVRAMAYLEGNGESNDAVLESIGVETYPMIEPDEPCSSGRS